jgi:transcriptional regulator with XRE-family HTH domain
MTIGERLLRLRTDAGMSQADVAGADMSPAYVSLIEKGKRHPSLEMVHALAARLDVTVEDLLDDEPSERSRRIDLEIMFAKLAIEHGEAADARDRLQALLGEGKLRRAVRDEVRFLLARAYDHLDDSQAAIALLTRLFDECRKGSAHVPMCDVGIMLVGRYISAGDLGQATQAGEIAIEAAEAQGMAGSADYYDLVATVLLAYIERGDYSHATAELNRVLATLEGADHVDPAVAKPGQGALYWNAAVLAERQGEVHHAVKLAEKALGHMSELDNKRDFARLRMELAGLVLLADPTEIARAKDLLDRCEADLQDLGSRADLAVWCRTTAQVWLNLGDLGPSEARARQAVDMSAKASTSDKALAWVTLSDVLGAQGRPDEAQSALEVATATLSAINPPTRATALHWRAIAERFLEHGLQEQAITAFRNALDGGDLRDVTAQGRAHVSSLGQRAVANTGVITRSQPRVSL